MASIKVKFRPSTIPDREGVIYYQVIHERIPRQITTDFRLFRSEWDDSNGVVVSSQKNDRRHLIISIRDRIRWDLERLDRIIHNLDLRGLPYTADTIVDEFSRYTNEISLFNFMQRQIARLKRTGKTRTAETYIATLSSFKKFREGEDIKLDSITTGVMEEYQCWLQSQGMTPNTVSFYIRIIRAVYNRAVDDEIIENRHPFRRVYTGVDKTVKRALPLPIIKKIKALDLSADSRLQYARDMFILSFMLRGMSFIDMAYLKKTDLRNGHIIYRRRKTGQQLSIAWTDDMQEIVDRYAQNQSAYLLPIIKSDSSNARYAYKNAGEKINLYLKKVGELVGLDIPLSMYVARHSWASIAKSNGIPISIISEGLGHDNESTTRIYLASLDTTVIDSANEIILRLL